MLQSRKVQYSPFKQDTLSFSKHIYLMLFTKNKQKKHFPCLRNSQAGNGVIFRNSKHFKHIHTHKKKDAFQIRRIKILEVLRGLYAFFWQNHGPCMEREWTELTQCQLWTAHSRARALKHLQTNLGRERIRFLMETTHPEQRTQGQTLSSSLSSCSETSPQKDFSVPGCSHKLLDVVKLLESTNTDQRILGIFSSLQSYFSVCVWNWAKQLLVFCERKITLTFIIIRPFLKKKFLI